MTAGAGAPRAAVLVTGTEILIGRIRDRNGGFLAQQLEAHGVVLDRIVAVDDGEDEIRGALEELLAAGHDLVLTSGGLGPTHDDRTVAAVAAAVGRPLVLDEPTLARIDEITSAFARHRGVEAAAYVAGNRKQALVPEGAAVLDPVGTAPGVVVEHGRQVIVVLPGPPAELAAMWAVVPGHPLVAPLLARSRLRRRLLRLHGASESVIATAFEELGGDRGGTETTICSSRLEIEVLVRYGPEAAAAADALVDGLRERFADAVYAVDDERTIEARVIDSLREHGLSIATAESCTAGLVAARLANVPGASDVLLGGVVAYANAIKEAALGVPADLLREHGAVSAETARAMAEGARRALAADVAVSVTGVAGPGGGTPDKPVGLVHICAVGLDGARAVEHRFGDRDRETIREWSTASALHLVRGLVEAAPVRG